MGREGLVQLPPNTAAAAATWCRDWHSPASGRRRCGLHVELQSSLLQVRVAVAAAGCRLAAATVASGRSRHKAAVPFFRGGRVRDGVIERERDRVRVELLLYGPIWAVV